jgi:hypothetical protein
LETRIGVLVFLILGKKKNGKREYGRFAREKGSYERERERD